MYISKALCECGISFRLKYVIQKLHFKVKLSSTQLLHNSSTIATITPKKKHKMCVTNVLGQMFFNRKLTDLA